MYGKIFDSIYDGTLVEDWRALVTFQQMIVLCDADGIVDMTPSAISRRTGIPIEHIKAGIEILEHADPYSRTPDEEGRRIVRLEDHRPWGWFIVNHEKYKVLQDSDTVREQNRERKRRQREREKAAANSHDASHGVTDGHAPSRHTDTDTDKDNIYRSFDRFWSAYPRKLGKQQALRTWKTKKLDKHADTICEHLAKRVSTDSQWLENRKFIPYPATFLNRGGWEDEYENAPEPPGIATIYGNL